MAVEVRELEPIMRMSDLVQLGLREFVCIQKLISEGQFERVEWA